MSKKRARTKPPLNMYDGPKYFDAKFTSEEREQLLDQIVEVSGIDFQNYFFTLQRPTEKEICRVLDAIGWGKLEDLYDYVLIKLCRDLEIDYKSFAKNEPKLPLDRFIAFAKREFPKSRMSFSICC